MSDEGHHGNCELCGHLLPEGAYGWCMPCDKADKRAMREQFGCICWGTGFSGMSVCGDPCPVHRGQAK